MSHLAFLFSVCHDKHTLRASHQKFMTRYIRYITLVLALICSACDPEKNVRGRVIPDEDMAALKKGVGSMQKEQVEVLIGPPSSILNYDPNTWYYFHLMTHTVGPFAPTVKANKSFALLFTPEGKLFKCIENSGTQEFELAMRQTALPSQHRQDFLKQLFRNSGRFNKKSAKTK
jgi:outer membrane protein assembly factor BamE (lipoprotein component of BamABCDE complex)